MFQQLLKMLSLPCNLQPFAVTITHTTTYMVATFLQLQPLLSYGTKNEVHCYH
jgi:hypothetical protein